MPYEKEIQIPQAANQVVIIDAAIWAAYVAKIDTLEKILHEFLHPETKILSTDEVAERLNVDMQTLNKYLKQKLISHTSIGKKRWITEAALAQFIAKFNIEARA